MKRIMSIILFTLVCQSCYFGAGAVEIDLPGNYFLFGNNSVEETEIILDTENHGTSLIVEQTVFAVGYNDEFIIAKSYSEKLKEIRYHIIEVKKELPKRNYGMSFEDYKLKRETLKIPYNLNFTIVFHEVSKN